jgi:hypothetical protein
MPVQVALAPLRADVNAAMQAALAPLRADVNDITRQLRKLARMTAIVSGTTAFVHTFTYILI